MGLAVGKDEAPRISSSPNSGPSNSDPVIIDRLSSPTEFFRSLIPACYAALAIIVVEILFLASSSFERASTASAIRTFGAVVLGALSVGLAGIWFKNEGRSLFKELSNAILTFRFPTALVLTICTGRYFYFLYRSDFVLDDSAVIQSATNGAALGLAFLIFDALFAHIRKRAEDLCHLTPDNLAVEAKVQTDDGKLQLTPARELRSGQLCSVIQGDKIPCDGEIESGSCVLRERRHAGLKFVRVRGANQRVIAGSEVISGKALIRCDQTVQESLATSFFERTNEQMGLDKIISAGASLQNILYGSGLFLAVCMALIAREIGLAPAQSIEILLGVLVATMLIEGAFLWLVLPRLAVRRLFDSGVLLNGLQSLDRARKLEHLAIDFTTKRPPGVFRVTDFHMIDERVERNRLESALHAVFCACDDELAEAFAEYLERSDGEPVACQVEEVHDYPGLGIAAKVEGIECSIGSEEFLIERGVSLIPTETVTVSKSAQVAYVALDEAVVAYFVMNDPFLHDGKVLKDELHKLHIATWLWSQDSQKSVDELARSTGFELGRVFGDLSPAAMQAKLQGLGEVGLYAHRDSDRELIRVAPLSISHFDELRWDLERSDITLVGRELWPIQTFFQEAKRQYRLAHELKITAAVIAAISLGLLIGAGITSAVVSAACLSGLTLMSLRTLANTHSVA